MTSVSVDVRAGAPTGERVLAYRLDKSRKVDWMAVLYMDGSSAEMVGNAPEIRLGSK